MTTALILSGGGARGAYEAGVVQGIVEVLGVPEAAPAPFQLFAGTSVGAINATFLASHAHRGDLAVHRLVDLWGSLSVGAHMRMVRRPWVRRALLEVEPIEALVREGTDWDALRDNVGAGIVRALLLAALHVDTGRTAVFADVAPGWRYTPTRDPRQMAIREPITCDHVLASAAIPAVFPPRRVGRCLYYDGGLRFNTPMAPAIRAGADRIVVVSPLYKGADVHGPPAAQLGEGGPDVLFLAGKMLNAVLLDPFEYDLQVLERFNALLELLEQQLDPDALRRLDRAVRELRGAPYRKLETLVIAPSADLGAVAVEHLHAHADGYRGQGAAGWLLSRAARRLERSETDLLSYLLFDGRFTARLAELGRHDALARADEVRAFFDRARDDPGERGDQPTSARTAAR